MKSDAILKFFYIIVSIILVRVLSFPALVSIVFALTMSHNTLAFFYSKSQRTYLAENWRNHIVPLIVLGCMIIGMMATDYPPIHFLFAIHHVCNEVFLVQRRLATIPKSIQISRTFLATVIFYAITSKDATYLPIMPTWAWTVALLVVGSGFLFSLAWERKNLPVGWLKKDLLFECSGFSVALWCAVYGSGTLDHILLYHFLLWGIYPIQRLRSSGFWPTFNYGFLTVFLFGLALAMTPIWLHIGGLNLDELSYSTRMFAFFHFSSSFALSQAHPFWIRRWFVRKKTYIEANRGQLAA